MLKYPYMRRLGKREYAELKEQARALASARLLHFNQFYGFTYKRVAIRNQRSRWGSCSKAGNLNFNAKIALLTPEQADYVIVHELCHLGEFNHSQNFWDLVARTIPNYEKLKHEIRHGVPKANVFSQLITYIMN